MIHLDAGRMLHNRKTRKQAEGLAAWTECKRKGWLSGQNEREDKRNPLPFVQRGGMFLQNEKKVFTTHWVTCNSIGIVQVFFGRTRRNPSARSKLMISRQTSGTGRCMARTHRHGGERGSHKTRGG
jgi:hypothetical protein